MGWADIEYILRQCKEKTKNKKAQWLTEYLETHIHNVSDHDEEPLCFDPFDIIKILQWLNLTK